MNIEQIKQVLPHRDPFLFLDRVIEISSEEIIAEKIKVIEDITKVMEPKGRLNNWFLIIV